MSSANIGWLFYKDYFRNIDYANLDNSDNEKKIKVKVANIISQTPEITDAIVLGNTHFTATTTYPGLLLGSGNSHELPHVKEQAILGFHFDYTSGLPVIQGSSLKGVLRSAFKHPEYIQELMNDESINIKDLESEIFENNDVFFDVTISHAESRILGDDFITPHADPLKDPKPLRFIKVLPDITFRFDFELSDGTVSKEKKRKLFENILEDLGLGAKTNVGYGKFTGFSPYKTEAEKVKALKEEKKKKEEVEAKRLQDIEDAKNNKANKAKEGINALMECKTSVEALSLLKESFGKVPKTTAEQKKVIEQFLKQNRFTPKEIKAFGKYLKNKK
jgi:CRISPR-associated protein Cmr6